MERAVAREKAGSGGSDVRKYYRKLTVQRLVELIRRDDYLALHEFVARYRPMLINFAERVGLKGADLDTVAADVLTDVAIRLLKSRRYPRSMELYLVACFKNRLLNLERSRRRIGEMSVLNGGENEPPYPSLSSQAALRESAGPLWEPLPLAPGVELLASLLDEGLSRDERLLLAWVSEHVPQSEIACWLGISHAAARKQLERLRRRLALTAKQYWHSISGCEHDALEHFFRRLDATIDAEHGERGPSSNPKKVSNE
ncbi:MAG TPA: hypothetical protein VJ803_08870 [Gemmatimonadaceae bacterium]|nr:hypothetical protein [Gemmatimonadaceae bacterium]